MDSGLPVLDRIRSLMDLSSSTGAAGVVGAAGVEGAGVVVEVLGADGAAGVSAGAEEPQAVIAIEAAIARASTLVNFLFIAFNLLSYFMDYNNL